MSDQVFHINAESTLPLLKMELINDGHHTFHKFMECIQSATITFSMTNINTGIIKISDQPAYVVEKEDSGCEKEYVICYNWKPRDTKEKGIYEGKFNIQFDGTLTSEYATYPQGNLIMPIREKLIISIQ